PPPQAASTNKGNVLTVGLTKCFLELFVMPPNLETDSQEVYFFLQTANCRAPFAKHWVSRRGFAKIIFAVV
ncbi:MAG: hypothetical protein EBT71_03845, partial [Alphaproteobacteria bacterium]|nr:hypothetical protein [Alphaproteobacteria bacterium]